MQLTPASIILALFVAGALAAPAPYSDEEFNLVVRTTEQRIANLPAELRNQIGRDAAAAQRATLQKAQNRDKYKAGVVKPLKKGNPVPKRWDQSDSLDIYSNNRGRGFYDDLLEQREFIDLVAELVARGGGNDKGKGKKQPTTDQRIAKLPAELRNQIGKDASAAQKATLQKAQNRDAYKGGVVQPLKKGDPVPNRWDQSDSLDIYSKNRGRGYSDDLLEERELIDILAELVARGGGNDKGKKQPSTDQRIAKLPAELRNQIGKDAAGAQKATLQKAQNRDQYRGGVVQPLKKGDPVPKRWDQSDSLDIYSKNRGRGFDDLLEERELLEFLDALD